MTVFLTRTVAHGQTDKCETELYGKWILSTKVDSLKSKSGTPTMTFSKSGKFIDNEGDYSSKGTFTVNKCSVKMYYDNGDTSICEITFIDTRCLQLTYGSGINTRTYLYKRNKK